jgi:hypothetical protein
MTSGTRVRSLRVPGNTGVVEYSCSRPPGAPAGSGPWYMVCWDRIPDAPEQACDLEVIR